METKLFSKNSRATIGPDLAFVIIGERINPTRRKSLLESLRTSDFSIALEDARRQVEAGAQVLDANVGVPDTDEPELLKNLSRALVDAVDVPLCFDSANPVALEAALTVYSGKGLINSTTGEDKVMNAVLPLAAKYGAAVIGVVTDESGIPPTPEARLAVARKIVNRASDYGVPPADVVIDCLALTVGADSNAGRITLDTMRLVQQELGLNLSLGASNVSFGLPERKSINTAYLALGIARGLTAAIADPTVAEVRTIVLACDLLTGRDEDARRWIKSCRAQRRRNKESEALFLGVDHPGLYPQRATAAEIAAWYERRFDFRCDENPSSYFLSGSGQGRLEVMKEHLPAHCHVAIRVADFDAALVDLQRKGVALEEPSIAPNKKTVFLHESDPEGNLVHLVWLPD
jgi:5-methyltetrahydrofolate--homocysteine methyltransferase